MRILARLVAWLRALRRPARPMAPAPKWSTWGGMAVRDLRVDEAGPPASTRPRRWIDGKRERGAR